MVGLEKNRPKTGRQFLTQIKKVYKNEEKRKRK